MKRLLLFLLLGLGLQAQELSPWERLEVYPLKTRGYTLSGFIGFTAPRPGFVHVENGRFHEDEGRLIETGGLILPGLIDLHDHVGYAYAHRFAGTLWPETRKFANRYEWQQLTEEFHGKHSRLVKPVAALFYLYGEVRELVGGTTSTANHVKPPAYSLLARNLDGPRAHHGLPINIQSEVFFFERREMLQDPPLFRVSQETYDKLIQADLALVHLAEGRKSDNLTRLEFEAFLGWAQENPDLARKIVPIHLVGTEPDDFARLKEVGIDKAVWSPASNMALYGETMDVETALDQGFTVALGTDWYPSGSDSLFDELRFAKKLYPDLDHDTLNDMLLRAPRRILGDLGSPAPGEPADLVVVPWQGDLETSLANADIDTILLVAVDGQPLFGTTALMERLLLQTFPSPVRPQSHCYGFNLGAIWSEVLDRFPEAVLPETLGESSYPR